LAIENHAAQQSSGELTGLEQSCAESHRGSKIG